VGTPHQDTSPRVFRTYLLEGSGIFCFLGNSLKYYAYVRETVQPCTSRVNWFPNEIISSTNKNKRKASLIAISSHELAMIRITTLLNIPPFNNVKKLAILSIYIIWDIFRIFFSKYASVLLIRNVFNSGDFCFL
jgi:hypothetical protein